MQDVEEIRVEPQEKLVSIPFKRESVLQDIQVLDSFAGEAEFQFPSNGKVYCKQKYYGFFLDQEFYEVSIPFKRESVLQVFDAGRNSFCKCVSIPFKRESVLQAIDRHSNSLHCFRFNSLQTGKCIQRVRGLPVLQARG